MADLSFLGPERAYLRAVIALILVVVVPVFCAGLLNEWRYFAFPLGTFVVALGIPLGLIAVAMIAPRIADEETPES
jgi:small neutral amino acid transporter SnatA (MarC family)